MREQVHILSARPLPRVLVCSASQPKAAAVPLESSRVDQSSFVSLKTNNFDEPDQ